MCVCVCVCVCVRERELPVRDRDGLQQVQEPLPQPGSRCRHSTDRALRPVTEQTGSQF